MVIFSPLKKEEVPEAYQHLFDWDDVDNLFRIDQRHDGTRWRRVSKVRISCMYCERENWIAINDVRNWVRGQRQGPFPGTHRGCKYPGKTITSAGYVWIWKPDHPKAYDGKYVPEHILITEEHLGRYLDRETESVHHINGDRQDNRIENLQLRNKYHGRGQKWICGDCGSNNVVAESLD